MEKIYNLFLEMLFGQLFRYLTTYLYII